MFSFRERLRYSFDNLLAKGTLALVAALAVMSAISIAASAVFVLLFHDKPEGANEELSFAEAMWVALTREMDAGNVAGDSGALRAIMFVATLAGIFIFSLSLIHI